MTVTSDQCSHRLGNATVRSRVSVRLRFPDGYTATADVLTFHGLADGKEHLLLGLGAGNTCSTGNRRVLRPLSGSTANASPAMCSVANAATAAPSCAKAWRRSRRPAGSCCTCGGRQGHRPVRKARRLRVAGCGPGYLRSERGTGPWRGRARLHGCCPDARCSWCHVDPPPQQQPGQDVATDGARHRDHRAGPYGGAPVCGEPPIPRRKAGPHRPHLGLCGLRTRADMTIFIDDLSAGLRPIPNPCFLNACSRGHTHWPSPPSQLMRNF